MVMNPKNHPDNLHASIPVSQYFCKLFFWVEVVKRVRASVGWFFDFVKNLGLGVLRTSSEGSESIV
jgi:hypothetical protein